MEHGNPLSTPLVPLLSGAVRTGVPFAWLKREVEAGRLPAVRAGRRFFVNTDLLTRALLERAGTTTPLEVANHGS